MGRHKMCKFCGMPHPDSVHTEKYEVKRHIPDKGFPTHDPHYKTDHEEASKAEKKRFPSGYKELKHLDESIGHSGSKKGGRELLGKSTKEGKIEVSKKVAPRLRSEVAYHEKIENRNLKKDKK